MTLSREVMQAALGDAARQIADAYRVQGEARAELWESVARYLETGTAVPVHEDQLLVGAVSAAEFTLEAYLRQFHEGQASYWRNYRQEKST